MTIPTVTGYDLQRRVLGTHTPKTSNISMVFAFQPNRGHYGRIFLPKMHLLFPFILKRIAKGWDRTAKQRNTQAAGAV